MDTREHLTHYLSDANAAEVGIMEMLEDAINLCNEPAKTAIRDHLAITKTQAERLEQRLEALGGSSSAPKGFMNTLMAKAGAMMDVAHDDTDRQTMCLVKLYASEHLEIAMYEALATYAEAIGDSETASLARQIQREEETAAQTIFPMIREYARVPAETSKPVERESFPYTGP